MVCQIQYLSCQKTCAGASPFVENVTRFTAMDYAIVKRDAVLLRMLERYGYFSQYMRVRVKKNLGFSKAWVPKWVAVIPRYGCPLRPQQQSRRLLFIYNDARSFDPLCKMYLDGSVISQVIGDNGEVQAMLVRPITIIHCFNVNVTGPASISHPTERCCYEQEHSRAVDHQLQGTTNQRRPSLCLH